MTKHDLKSALRLIHLCSADTELGYAIAKNSQDAKGNCMHRLAIELRKRGYIVFTRGYTAKLTNKGREELK